MWIPDPRFEMPELFEPGRKPTGEVVAEQGFAESFYLLNERAGTVAHDLIGLNDAPLDSVAGAWELTPHGWGYNPQDNNGFMSSPGLAGAVGDCTIFAIAIADVPVSGDNTICSLQTDNGTGHAELFWLDIQTTTGVRLGARFVQNATFYGTGNYAVTAGELIKAVGTRKGGTLTLWVNGVQIAQTTGANTSLFDGSRFRIGAAWSKNAILNSYNEPIFCSGFDLRAWSDEEILEWMEHPYGSGDNPVLIPS